MRDRRFESRDKIGYEVEGVHEVVEDSSGRERVSTCSSVRNPKTKVESLGHSAARIENVLWNSRDSTSRIEEIAR